MVNFLLKIPRIILRRRRLNARWGIFICAIIAIQLFQLFWNLHLYKTLNEQSLRDGAVQRAHIVGIVDGKTALKQKQDASNDDTHIFENSEHRKCKNVSSLGSVMILNRQSVSSMSDWTFTQTQRCGDISITDLPKQRYKFSLECDTDMLDVPTSQSRNATGIFTVKFGDPCLSEYIDRCCRDKHSVPNIIHYVWFGSKELGYFNFLSLMSALRFQKPCLILIHGPTVPHGTYWEYFLHVSPNVAHVYRESPTVVFGNKLRFKEHASDIMRIEALIRFGGIYLDFDELILQSLDSLRQYKHTQGHEMPFSMGSQLVMSMKNSTFLHLWYNSYRDDYRHSWAYNALWVPNNLAKKYPGLIHVEGFNFTRPNWKNTKDIYDHNYNWSTNYGMHMYARWYRRPIDLNIIRTLNTTVGSVSRHIMFGNKELCQS